MKSRLIVLCLLLQIAHLSYAKSNDNFNLKNGILDLSIVEISETNMIKIQGMAEFYPNQLLSPQDLKDSKLKTNFIYGEIPKSWTSYKLNDKKLDAKGYGTYRFFIKKRADKEKTIYGLKIFTVFSNYSLWINGKLVKEVGKVNSSEDQSFAKFEYCDIPIVLDPTVDNTEELELVFQVSNYHHVRAGLARPFYFSRHETLLKEKRNKDILNLIILGIVLIISINHLIMFLYRRKDKSNLYFSILSLVMILRNISTDDRIITYIFPDLNWELLFKLDNFSGFGTIPIFALFFYILYKQDFPKLIKNIFILIGVIITIIVFYAPAISYGKYRMFFEVYILIGGLYLTFGVLMLAAFRKRPAAIYSFIAMFILYGTAINDVLSSMGVIESAYIAPYGLVAFMLIQSFTMISKSATAINQNEKLSVELQMEKENLEMNIEERTQELQRQHDTLLVHQKKEQEQNWINVGFAQINELLSSNKENYVQLSKVVLSALIKYMNAQLGTLYIINKEDGDNNYLELVADYGMSKEAKEQNMQVPPEVGLLGAAYKENQIQLIENVPENYYKIASGMGKASPRNIIICPLSTDDDKYGVLEIASLNKFKVIEIEFIEKVANSIANTINNVKINQKNMALIEQFRQQTEEMNEKEEEMRQSLEELQYIREKYDELKKKTSKPNKSNKKA